MAPERFRHRVLVNCCLYGPQQLDRHFSRQLLAGHLLGQHQATLNMY